MYSLGIDSGSTTTKAVLFDGHKIMEKILVSTGPNPKRTMRELYDKLHKENTYTVTTGYGRALLESKDKQITEITCHAAGAVYLDKTINGIIDIGGQDSKVILLDDQNHVRDFLMNDKCAAGTGRFIEVIMRLLHEDIDDFDTFVAGSSGTKISSMCTVFAESEVISLLANEVSPSSIALGVVESIAHRTSNFAKRLPIHGKVFFSGGLAQVKTMKTSLEEALEIELVTHEDAQFVGAIGAAVLGYKQMLK